MTLDFHFLAEVAEDSVQAKQPESDPKRKLFLLLQQPVVSLLTILRSKISENFAAP